jgi:Tfp pilus assembly protein PilF
MHFLYFRQLMVLAGLGLLTGPGLAWPAPFVPADDAVVLEKLPYRAADPAQRELRALRAALAGNPRDPERAIALARRYFDLALGQGDPRYIGYAEAALRALPETDAPSIDLLIVRAQLAQYRHQFVRANALLEQALSAEPEDPEALAWSAAVRMVQADYAGAQRYCERLARVASELLGTGCLAHVAAATGKLRTAYGRLLAASTRHPAARPTLKLWTYTLLADMAQRLGDAGAADSHYRSAIALGETDQYLLAAYAEFLLDERRPAEAEALLRDWERSDVLLLLQARALKALGRPEVSALASKLQARYAADAQRGERLHAQDEARFRLEFLADAKGALTLAAQNWSEQREAADARILMEAALAAKEPQLAQPALDWLAASGYEDLRLARLAAQLRSMTRASAR